jgi:flagellin
MSMVINTNISSMVAQGAQAENAKLMDTAMERLASGKRINSAADDAAGMAMASRMESQVKGLSMALKNAGDAQSLIETAEGAQAEISNILLRMRELAIQSASDTNVSLDRANLQSEVTQLAAEIDRIANQTTWNGVNLLDGTYTNKSFQIGSEANQTIAVSVESAATSSIGAFTDVLDAKIAAAANTATNGNAVGDTFAISGYLGTANATFSAGDSAKTIAAAVNAVTADTGVSATARTKMSFDTLNTSGTLGMTINGTAITSAAVTTTDLTDLRDKINAISSTTGVVAALGSSNAVLNLEDLDGDNIVLTAMSHSDANATMNSKALNSAGGTVRTEGLTLNNDTAAAIGFVDLSSTKTFSLDASTGTDYDDTNATATNVSGISIATASGASSAIVAIDGALEGMAMQRATLGSVSNRLDYTMSNLASTRVSMEASQSRIEDADFAAETSNLTKAQILSQAATAMLAQANASKQSVLSLLQG